MTVQNVGNTSQKSTVTTIRHPYYDAHIQEWTKWRSTYEGGRQFIDRYLEKFSRRELREDFDRRKNISYNPAFAKEAIDEIKNSLFQRFDDISRKGGSTSYGKAVQGLEGGIDLEGNSMNSFVGCRILPELLVMSKVGVFVDMPYLDGLTVADNVGKRPYLYVYSAEDILSWAYNDEYGQNKYSTILLKENVFVYDDETGLPSGEATRYRRMWIGKDGRVNFVFYDQTGQPQPGFENEEPVVLDITEIPFVSLTLSGSLMKDVANYQIALLNLASSDMAYALQSNFPFYTEQFEPRAEQMFGRPPGEQGGQATDAATAKAQEVRVGAAAGRRYPKGTDRPGFIHPSAEPLNASMAKQEQLKREIRQLVNLAVQNLSHNTARQPAASKQIDQQGLESGLAYIGLELEKAERLIARYWGKYETKDAATVHYPKKYSLKTDQDRRDEAKELQAQQTSVPSKTFHKVIARKIADLLISHDTSDTEMQLILDEIDNAKAVNCDPTIIAKDVEMGYCNLDLAAELRGYPKGTAEKAAEDHAARLTRISKQQSSAVGPNGALPDVNPGQPPNKPPDNTQDPKVVDPKRGAGQKPDYQKKGE